MQDRDILNLISLAREAEQFEQDALGEVAGSPRTPAHRSRWVIGAGLAAVAGLAIAGVLLYQPGPGRVTPPTGVIAQGAAPKADPKASGVNAPVISTASTQGTESVTQNTRVADAEPSMLLTIFESPGDGCQCVTWREVHWAGGKSLEHVGRSELIDAAMRQRCSGGSSSVLVLALQGPRDQLPPDSVSAQALAACFSAEGEACGNDPHCYSASALGCLPPGVNVLAEKISLAAK